MSVGYAAQMAWQHAHLPMWSFRLSNLLRLAPMPSLSGSRFSPSLRRGPNTVQPCWTRFLDKENSQRHCRIKVAASQPFRVQLFFPHRLPVPRPPHRAEGVKRFQDGSSLCSSALRWLWCAPPWGVSCFYSIVSRNVILLGAPRSVSKASLRKMPTETNSIRWKCKLRGGGVASRGKIEQLHIYSLSRGNGTITYSIT